MLRLHVGRPGLETGAKPLHFAFLWKWKEHLFQVGVLHQVVDGDGHTEKKNGLGCQGGPRSC